ncbi:hypothetical protein EDC94DRAFT_121087 [Helicostylum pulchrum]|nr:hypothetical protein EDC94DRAFT_121087 [Helicostylum pulchrum]
MAPPFNTFKEDYGNYWGKRKQDEAKEHQQITDQQQSTLNSINSMALTSLENYATQVYDDIRCYSNDDDIEMVQNIMSTSKLLSSDLVCHIEVIDLTSETIREMLEQLDPQMHSGIMLASTITPFTMSEYGLEIINAFSGTSPSRMALRKTLIEYGPKLYHVNIVNADRAFVEVTVRHFMDFMDSNRNPLLFPTNERSACIDTTAFIINRLFISHNDIVKLNWIECEHCTTSTRKWDGILIKVDDHVVSTCLIEFAGGIQCNSISTKEKSDTTKLYKNMKKIIKNLPDNIPKRVYCVRFFDSSLFFEELFMFENKFYRNEHAKIV